MKVEAVSDCWLWRSFSFCSSMATSFSTIVNWAVCDTNSVPSAGFIGSWYFIWATSSLRNASLPSELSGPLTVVAVPERAMFGSRASVVVIAGLLDPHVDGGIAIDRSGRVGFGEQRIEVQRGRRRRGPTVVPVLRAR